MKISQYDNSLLVAESDTQKLYIVKWGKLTRFALSADSTFSSFSFVGDQFENKTQFVTNAWDYAFNVCDFKDSEIMSTYPRNRQVVISQNEKVAINTAIRLLNSSNSDHADQCLCYLNTLKNKL